jgi:hypothetical protein
MPSWTTVTAAFDEFVADNGVSYTLTEALENAVTLVWEVSDVEQVGWFMIDNVDFTTTASSRNSGEDEDSDDEDDGGDLSGKDPADSFTTSGVMGLSLLVSILISYTFGICRVKTHASSTILWLSKKIAIKEK